MAIHAAVEPLVGQLVEKEKVVEAVTAVMAPILEEIKQEPVLYDVPEAKVEVKDNVVNVTFNGMPVKFLKPLTGSNG
jgi:hypothetical protein